MMFHGGIEALRVNVLENQNQENLKKKIDFLLAKHIEGNGIGMIME